jgi:hypothetical protein
MPDIFSLVKTNETICADETTGICSRGKVREALLEFGESKDEHNALDNAKQKTNCKDEVCVLNSDRFKWKSDLRRQDITIEIMKTMKPVGPRNTLKLINNEDIEKTFARWEKEFPSFISLDFAMADFMTHINPITKVDYKLKTIDLGMMKREKKCASCVLNTDISEGKGKHWVCLFIDCRTHPETIEYFNSSGKYPFDQINRWMKDACKKKGFERVIVSTIKHQYHDTECGLYAMFYTRARLDGINYTYFGKNRITDEKMTTFRKHLFR